MRDDLVHADVERFRRNFLYDLKRETNPSFVRGRYAWEQPVVISLSSSQTVSVAVECYAGNNDQVYCGIVGKQCPGRFFNAVCADSKVCRTCVGTKLQVITRDDGQKYPFLHAPFSDEAVRVHFIGQ